MVGYSYVDKFQKEVIAKVHDICKILFNLQYFYVISIFILNIKIFINMTFLTKKI